MVARPIVVAPVTGLLLGEPQAGMLAGVLLEILSLHQLPIGANRHWDTGPAAVAAAVAMVAVRGPVGLVVAGGAGVLIGWLGSWSVHGLRHLNARLVVVDEGPGLRPASLTARHLAAIALDFARAVTLTLLAVWVVLRGTEGIAGAPAEAGWVAALVAAALGGLALGADVRMVAGGRRVWTAFGIGSVLSTIVWVWLH